MFKSILIIASLVMTGCASELEKAIGVEVTDNAFLCVHIDIDSVFTESSGTISRIEFPIDYDFSSLSKQDLQDLLDNC